jgi:hypothetical protein
MSLREQRERLLLEMKTAEDRYLWAKAEAASKGASPALTKFIEESRQEWRSLQTKLAKRDAPAKPAKKAPVRAS